MSHRRLSETWIQRQSPKNIGKPTTSHWMLEKAHASNLLQCSGIWSRLLPLQYRIASFKPASSHEPQSAISKSWGNGVDMSSPASAWAAKTDILDLGRDGISNEFLWRFYSTLLCLFLYLFLFLFPLLLLYQSTLSYCNRLLLQHLGDQTLQTSFCQELFGYRLHPAYPCTTQ